MAELRSFIFLDQLQPQTMCYLGTWVRGRLPRAGVAAQVIEIAPGLDIEPLTDVALKDADVQAGILVVERQFGYLELHGTTDAVRRRRLGPGGARGQRHLGDQAAGPRVADHHPRGRPARVPGQQEQARLDGAAR